MPVAITNRLQRRIIGRAVEALVADILVFIVATTIAFRPVEDRSKKSVRLDVPTGQSLVLRGHRKRLQNPSDMNKLCLGKGGGVGKNTHLKRSCVFTPVRQLKSEVCTFVRLRERKASGVSRETYFVCFEWPTSNFCDGQ